MYRRVCSRQEFSNIQSQTRYDSSAGIVPFIFPGWFPEMARLGNDSVIALLVASALAVFTVAPMKAWSTYLLLGVIRGFSALTEATFVPFWPLSFFWCSIGLGDVMHPLGNS